MTCKLIYVAGCNKSPPTFNVCTFPNYFYVLFVRVSVNVQPIMLELGLLLNLCALHTGGIDILPTPPIITWLFVTKSKLIDSKTNYTRLGMLEECFVYLKETLKILN